jgi:Protein kinase domain
MCSVMRKRADKPVAVPTNIGPGSVLSNRFRLIKPIGSGGMAVVWRAEHLTLGIPVALKMLRPVDAHRSVARARFEKEARTVAALRHPNVVHILEYGVHGDLPFLAMELLEGETLAKRLEGVGTLDTTTVVWLVEQIARPVDKAHTLGIVHRDIKPENIFLQSSEDGEIPKLVDFGIAKLIDGDKNDSLTRTDAVIGTTHYLSPERARGRKPLDGRVDLWALAVVVYECVIGQRPFDEHADDLLGLLRAIAEVDYPPPSMLGSVPPDFDAWMDKALNPNPDRRYANAAEMASSLRDALLPGTVASSTGMAFEALEDGMLPVGPEAASESREIEYPRTEGRELGEPEEPELTGVTSELDLTGAVLDAMMMPLPAPAPARPSIERRSQPGPQLRRFDLSAHPQAVDVEPTVQPTDCAELEYFPPTEQLRAAVEDSLPTRTVQEFAALGHETVPIVSATVTTAMAAPPIPEPVEVVAPKRDWRLFAMAAISMIVASVVGVSLVRLVTPQAHHELETGVPAVESSLVSIAATAPPEASPPAIPASALPPAISVAPPVLDVERLPVPDSESPSSPPTQVRPPRNAGRPGTGRKPHEVFGL